MSTDSNQSQGTQPVQANPPKGTSLKANSPVVNPPNANPRKANPLMTKPIAIYGGWSGFVVEGAGGAGSDPSEADWSKYLARIVESPSTLPGYSVLKYSAGGEVFSATLDFQSGPLEVVCKQSRPRGLVRRLATLVSGSRERRNFHRALSVQQAGIETAAPLALLERRKPRREAWLVTEYLADTIDLDHFVLTLLPRLDSRQALRTKRRIIQVVAELFLRLDQAGLRHRDLKASNLLMRGLEESEGDLRVAIVDLDGLGSCRHQPNTLSEQPLVRLAASLAGYSGVTRTDFARLLRQYARDIGLPSDAWKPLFHRLGERARRYAEDARSRKTHKLDGYAGD